MGVCIKFPDFQAAQKVWTVDGTRPRRSVTTRKRTTMADLTPPYETFFIPKKVTPEPRPWVGLTEDEAIELLPAGDWEIESTLGFAHAIEAKLRERNGE